jgi:hypothetical protein
MSYLRRRAAAILAALLPLGLAVAILGLAAPASALTFTAQCDLANGCANFWGGGYAVSVDYGALTGNDNITVVWIYGNHTQFELRDNVHGGCVGDYQGNQSSARAGGGQSCPSSGTAGWGTVFSTHTGCIFAGYGEYYNQHWRAFLGWGTANGSGAYLNTGGHCIQQRS